MLMMRFDEGMEPLFPADLGLSVRERNDGTILLEHQGDLAQLLKWLGTVKVRDLAIGTEDLRSLYDQFHGPNVPDDEEVAV